MKLSRANRALVRKYRIRRATLTLTQTVGTFTKTRRASGQTLSVPRARCRAPRMEGDRSTYFVTGATGFIGRNLVERLLERGR